jgi:hypothetical protein
MDYRLHLQIAVVGLIALLAIVLVAYTRAQTAFNPVSIDNSTDTQKGPRLDKSRPISQMH